MNHKFNLLPWGSGMMLLSLLYLPGCFQRNTEIQSPPNPTPPTNPYPNFKPTELQGEKNFAFLINNYPQGKVEPQPWAGYWWPYTKNGIAAGGFMDGQSPAGKYDAARGGVTHAQSWEIIHHGASVPKVQQWWGHCNGWCAAAALFPEPTSSVKVNGITFSVGDIKGLLTEAGMSVSADFFGDRVNIDDPNSPQYLDTVPDQYFLVLTNFIGRLKHAVLIDRYTGSQVWNQPLAGYRFEYPKPSDYLGNLPEAPHIYRIMLTSTIWWMDDGVDPSIQTPPFNYEDDPNGVIQSRTLRMEVWVDAPITFNEHGKIIASGDVVVMRREKSLIGGEWRIGEGYLVDGWPDYMWVPYQLTAPHDTEQDYVNPEIELEWIKSHLLTPGGSDDPSITPAPIEPAPMPIPSGFPTGFPSGPRPTLPSLPSFPRTGN
ncbi:hypothetical protein EBS43_05645 [bacterium]|nr:hypothetical protein [bacterium]